MKLFVNFPWHLYRGNSCWTPPLTGALLGNRLFGQVGILTPKHPYHQHAEVTHYLAWRGSQPVGRISAAINHRFKSYYNSRIGFFGFRETVKDYEVASALFDRARDWVKDRGMTVLRGPGEYSNTTHERQGVLIDGFQYPPMMELTHNQPYYGEFLERYGFRKAKDYHAYTLDIQTPIPERLSRLDKQVRLRGEIETRAANPKEFLNEVQLMLKIYNDSWTENWGFLPITEEEAVILAGSLRQIVEPELIRLAFVRGEPAAVLGAIPDPYYALRPRWHWYGDSDLFRLARLFLIRRRIPRFRLMFLGVRPKFRHLGIEVLLFVEAKKYAMQKRYRKCEASLILEDNYLSLRPLEFVGARNYKTWRVYDLLLE